MTWTVTKREIRAAAMEGAATPPPSPKPTSKAMQEAEAVSMAVAGDRQGAGRLIELSALF